MNKNTFANKIFIIFEDRGLKEPSVNWLNMLYGQCENLPDEKIDSGLKKIMSINQEEWNKKYGFGGKPALSDWLKFFNNDSASKEQYVLLEISRVLDHAQYWCGTKVDFGDDITNAMVNKYGGLGKIKFDLFDSYNPKPRSREWVVKELNELWFACNFTQEKDKYCFGKGSLSNTIEEIRKSNSNYMLTNNN